MSERFDVLVRQPTRRPLQIFAIDPLGPRDSGNRITVEITNESPKPGPVGERLCVVDYDGGHNCWYRPVNLDDPAILLQGGLDPSEADPRFHQQMVYAVAMRTLESFDRALGRWLSFKTGSHERLRLLPHAFHGANAFYSRDLHAVLFGYFCAGTETFGRNLPGQMVFTCLTHDIVAHEMTHAVVDRLRRHFLEPTNEDVLAFHEGFADIVALFQHFTFARLLESTIQATQGRLDEPTPLVYLAQQFGEATGLGQALRSALGKDDVVLSPSVLEPHARGAILVAAVFDGFFATFQRRIRDLVRIATGGTGIMPQGDLHPDLVQRIAAEAATAAQGILSMCIRAFDYMAPVDVSFGDFLRAMVTADYEMSSTDATGQRECMIEAFRRRRIYAESVTSSAEESLLWPMAFAVPKVPVRRSPAILRYLIESATNFGRVVKQTVTDPVDPTDRDEDDTDEARQYQKDDEGNEIPDLSRAMALALSSYANANRQELKLHPTLDIQVQGFHTVFRVAPSGRLLIELVLQFVQTDKSQSMGGVPLRGGTTVIAAADGTVRYVIAKPIHTDADVPADKAAAVARLERQRCYLAAADSLDPETSFMSPDELANRMSRRADFAKLHFS